MPLHRGLMTLEEFDALPEDNSAHYELQEGVLVMSPRAARRHQQALVELALQVREQIPDGWDCVIDFEVILRSESPVILRAPDLVVVPSDGPQNRVTAEEVRLAVEIISPGTRNVDMHLKSFEYADAGIPNYWVIDLDPPLPTITVFGLGAPGDGYRESQNATGELVVTEPFPLRIDIDALVARRGA
ncbi:MULTISPECIES: Uma2 family endonuclease [unclassified Pseudonocardia]|nr:MULTISPECIES: Uma2 family endonuclease [unclassified Pseudonocardia]